MGIDTDLLDRRVEGRLRGICFARRASWLT